MVLNDVHNVYSDNLLNARKCKGLCNKGPIEVFVGQIGKCGDVDDMHTS
jgi:hypothetical protein